MMEEEINEGNILIAKFMEHDKLLSYELLGVSPYDQHWNKLMGVVEKIGKMIIPKEYTKDAWNVDVHYGISKVATIFTIGDNSLFITDSGIADGKNIKLREWLNVDKSPLERTWLATVNFIKWYNQLTPNK